MIDPPNAGDGSGRPEDALSGRLLRAVLESAQEAVLCADSERRVLTWNAAAERLFGYRVHEIVGRSIDILVPPRHLKAHQEGFARALRGGMLSSPREPIEISALSKEGREFPVTIRLSMVGKNKSAICVASIHDLSEKKKLEDAGRELTQRLHILFETAPIGIVILDPDGKVAMLNPHAESMFGWSSEEQIGKLPLQLPPSEGDFFRRHLSAILSGETPPPVEVPCLRRDGSVIFCTLSAAAMRSAQGKIAGVIALLLDVTERREAEEKTRSAETRFRTVFEHSPFGTAILDPETLLHLEFNERAHLMLGYAREEFARLKASEYLVGWTAEGMRENLRKIVREGRAEMELRFRTKSGEVRNVRVNARRIELSGKAYILSMRQDVTETLRGQAHERLLGRVVEASTNVVIVTDPEGLIEYVNPKFTETTGWSAEEVLGKNPRILKSGDAPVEVYRGLWETVLSGKEWRGEFKNKRKDGKFYWASCSVSSIRDAENAITHLIGIQEDITERKRLQEQFLQAQKMESLGRLAGGVAHDFNNLLTAILGYSELALSALPNDSPVREDVSEIRETARRAANLTRQLLAFSRRQVVAAVELDLNPVVMSLHKMLRRLIGEDVELVILPCSEPLFVRADPGQLEQVVVNMAVNARDAMPEGGSLRLELSFLRFKETDTVPVAGMPPGEYARLRVVDTGAGMSPEVLSRIFEPFFTTKEQGKGTGLGLATCFGVVSQSGGFISAQSVRGRGTTMSVFLPRLGSAAAAEPEPARAAAQAGTGTILLVEDEPAVRSMAARVLRRSGYAVLEASNGEEALRVAAKSGPGSIQLVLTDIVMPQMDGKAFSEEFTRLNPGVCVLFMSGYIEESMLRKQALDPDRNFLQKPFTPAALSARVRLLLSGT